MHEFAVDHVRDRLESAMWMIRRAFRLADAVLHLAHLVEQDEWVRDGALEAGEWPADREAFAFVRLDRVHDPLDAAEGEARIGLDGRESEWVFDGDGRHDESPVVVVSATIVAERSSRRG